MKLAVFALLLITGAVCYADTPDPVPSLYDQIIKEIYQRNQPMLELNGKQYLFGPFADEGPILKAVAADPKAVKLFQESISSGQVGLTLLITATGFDLVGLGFLLNDNSQPKGSSAPNAATWIGLGFACGAVVTSLLSIGYESDTQDKFFKGVNQYNRDILDAHP